MKSRMLLSPLWKIGSWKKLFLYGKKSLKKPTVELPHEIIEWEILPRLPAKSLRRFMCVCKQWELLISTCEFTTKNLQHINKQSLTHRILEINYSSQTFSTRDCDDLNKHDSTTTRSIPFVNGREVVFLLASLDGLVLVQLLTTGVHVLWNPLTGAYKRFSDFRDSNLSVDAYGFYFDSDKKDYKVLRVTCYGNAFQAFIYSQRLNSRKEIQWLENHQRLSYLVWSNPISLGESLYFMGRHKNDFTKRYQYWIIVFDVKSEKFREIHFPLLNQENKYIYGSLMIIKGCIQVFVTRNLKAAGELWRMDGDGDGWKKVQDFPPARNQYTLMYDEKIDMEHLTRNFDLCERWRKMLYLETLVSPK